MFAVLEEILYWRRTLLFLTAVALVAFTGVWLRNGVYGVNLVLRHGGTFWLPINPDSPRVSPSMRLAWSGNLPQATAGTFAWHSVAIGFEAADMPVIVGGNVVDHILLARIDPKHYRFAIRNEPSGDHDLDQWMADLGAALVVNGSYYGRYGEPATPVLSDGHALGPQKYDGRGGAFVASTDFVGIRNLTHENWRVAFGGARDAMISFPLLLAESKAQAIKPSDWLANRSFVAEDTNGKIVIGTTTDAFFSLARLATFLKAVPLDLTLALNLDGGGVACQGIAINGFQRRSYGQWEAQVDGKKGYLGVVPYGESPMPVVLALFPIDTKH